MGRKNENDQMFNLVCGFRAAQHGDGKDFKKYLQDLSGIVREQKKGSGLSKQNLRQIKGFLSGK